MARKNLIIATHAFAPEHERHMEGVTEAGITAQPCTHPCYPGLWNAFSKDSRIVIQDSTFHSEEAMRVMFALLANGTLPKNYGVEYEGARCSVAEITDIFNKRLNQGKPIVSVDVDVRSAPAPLYAVAFQNVLKFLHLSK